jgi:hypothetical protein
MSEANIFCCKLGLELQYLSGGIFKFYKSKLELRKKSDNGTDVIIISSSNKYSPHISISFYFGKIFNDVHLVEKMYGLQPMPYHIHQYSLNALSIPDLKYSGAYFWSVNITNPPTDLAEELMIAIQSIAYPFFDRFCDLRKARDAITSCNPWYFDAQGPAWHSLSSNYIFTANCQNFEALPTPRILDSIAQDSSAISFTDFARI